MVVPVSFRSRETCLSPADVKAFAATLVEAFPTARYYVPPGLGEGYDIEPPTIATALHLLDLTAYERWMHFDEEWVPQWRKDPDYGRWVLASPRLPSVRFQMGKVRPADECRPERISATEIDVSCRPHRKEDFAMARRLFHLLDKIATNRHQVYVSYPGYEVATVFEKGGSLWMGHDAIRWAREDPRRLLAMHTSGRGGIRPMDD
ncbi:MAG: hypothetical protein K2X44_04365 [Magnetospirillum sp.]|nr:hypothetical protein [Magnetospirillum sp.]